MKKFTYIIIGGGMTGSAAAMGIRELDREGSIAIFSKEKFGPYNRPPLSKGLWNGKDVDEIMRPMGKYNIDLFLETEIKEIIPPENIIIADNGEKFHYEKLLLANGGDPIRIPDTPDGVIFYRTRDDYHHLRELSKNKGDFCVIGGGFIGSEIAAALNKQGNQVTMIFPEIGISGLVFPDSLSKFLNDYYQEKGVSVLDGHLVNAIHKSDEKFIIRFNKVQDKKIIEQEFDGVVIGIGIRPNIALAQEAGIEVDDGIIVNENLQTNFTNIYAAGDVAQFFNPHLEKRTRVEHEDNANNMGMRAGKNMTGQMEAYTHFPFFYSDLFDLGYEAIGELNEDFEIHTDWIDEFNKGTIFYLDQGKIKGLIFWNLWGKVDEGRKIISEGKTFEPDDLPGMFS